MQIDVRTSAGPARLWVAPAAAPRAVLWLGHGAGGGIDAADLAALAAAFPERGVTIIRHEQPWRVAGGRVAPRPPILDRGWRESAAAVAELASGLPLFTGGRSAGARVACRTAAEVGAAGVVCLAFPLHWPGRPENSRLEELLLPEVPVLVAQGDRDTFGQAADVEREVAGRKRIRVVHVPGADHGMKVLKSSPLATRGVGELIVAAVGDFVDEVAGRRRAGDAAGGVKGLGLLLALTGGSLPAGREDAWGEWGLPSEHDQCRSAAECAALDVDRRRGGGRRSRGDGRDVVRGVRRPAALTLPGTRGW